MSFYIRNQDPLLTDIFLLQGTQILIIGLTVILYNKIKLNSFIVFINKEC